MGDEGEILLGIDPGSHVTGYGILRVRGNALRFVDMGVIKAPAKDGFHRRLAMIAAEMSAICLTHKPDIAIIERAFVAKNAHSAMRIAEMRGALAYVALRAGAAVAECSPRAAKMAVSGLGHARKSQVAFMIEKLLGVSTENADADATDAMAIAIRCALDRSLIEKADEERQAMGEAGPGGAPRRGKRFGR